ncbi:phage integrase central domain-containing protein [Bradyrhizobium canariense]|uniref:phage integrase central domain-containing protein n=1 Tax=Bradyrhizobium canariense TaxID=255045 RepID=UPI003D9B2D8A
MPKASIPQPTATRARSTIGAVFGFAIATSRAERDPTADLRGALITPTVTHRATIVEPKAVGACCVQSMALRDMP